ncbi:MAG: tellurite resistance TerB family protein [Pseudomonadota bacterium]
MIDAKALLEQFLGPQLQGGQQPVPGQDQPGQAQQGQSGDLGSMLQNLGQGLTDGKFGGFAGGAAAGGLAMMLLGTKAGRSVGGGALKLGALAAVGTLAYKAYQNYQAGKQPEAAPPSDMLPPPADTPFAPEAPQANEAAIAVLRAMIAAAKADGHIDAAERQRIMQGMDRAGLGAEEAAFIRQEIEAPLDAGAIASLGTTPELAAEIYTASLLAIDVDQPAERAYLDDLARKLGLPADLIAHLEATVAGAQAG